MRPTARRRFLQFALALAGLPAAARAEADPAVLAPVRALIAALLTIMKQGQAVPFVRRAETLAPVIAQAFDLETILRESVGSAWAGLLAAEQDALRGAFRDYTIASHVRNFDSFAGEQFEVLPDTRPIGNGVQVVQTRIVPPNGEAHALDYVMRAAGGAWRVVDVLADGSVSRVAVQRSDFRRLLAGGGAAALIDSLQTKARELAGS
jgi:phospholipid transport system substrate-binding protein